MEPGRQFMRVYHRTSQEAADAIHAEGRMTSKEDGHVFVSNRKHGQATGYGEAAVELRIPRKAARLDDEFPSGEKHYAVKASDIKPEHIVPPKKRAGT